MRAASLGRAVAHPLATAYFVLSRLDRARLFRRYGRRARLAGLDRLYLVLSFDCDTEADIDAAGDLHVRLMAEGILPVYAVPGRLLEKGRAVYRRIAETGAEFINHGYAEHTALSGGRHVGTLFYDRLDEPAIIEDIAGGDRAIAEVLGQRTIGFRAPHFGTLRRRHDLEVLHDYLRRLGYAYSSSTLPLYGLRRGPAFRSLGLWEFPVSGLGSAPLDVLDSWGFFAAPERNRGPEGYRREGMEAARWYAQAGAGIMNFYADPSHVHDSPEFLETVRIWARTGEATSYRDLLPLLR